MSAVTWQSLRSSSAFWSVLALFLVANIWSYLHQPACCGLLDGVGFPLAFLLDSEAHEKPQFFALSVLLDLTIALTAALLAAWIGISLRNRRSL